MSPRKVILSHLDARQQRKVLDELQKVNPAALLEDLIIHDRENGTMKVFDPKDP